MSRHLLVDRPDVQIVLGYDHPLHAFFGQRFNPSRKHSEGIAIGGWPTRTGLGVRRFVRSAVEAEKDLRLLFAWARQQQPEDVWGRPGASAHLDQLRLVLRREWSEGEDCHEEPPPAALRGAA